MVRVHHKTHGDPAGLPAVVKTPTAGRARMRDEEFARWYHTACEEMDAAKPCDREALTVALIDEVKRRGIPVADWEDAA